MEEHTTGDVLMAVFLCVAAVGGAAYGWFGVGTVWAALGGAAMIGIAALLVGIVVSFAVSGVAHLFRRRSG